jgi:calcium binding protein 39
MLSVATVHNKVVGYLKKLQPRLVSELAQSSFKASESKTFRRFQASLGVVAETCLKYGQESKRSIKPNSKTSVDGALTAYIDVLLTTDLAEFIMTQIGVFAATTRHDISHIVSLLNRHVEAKTRFHAYLNSRPVILATLVESMADPEICRVSGMLLQQVIRASGPLCASVLENEPVLDKVLEYCASDEFDLGAEGFSTLRMLLCRHKKVVVEFLVNDFDKFLLKYNKLLKSTTYITVRQSLQLLADILQVRSNFKFMIKFINSDRQLRVVLKLVFGKTQTTRFEAFKIFKIFVANPRKVPEITSMLLQHKDKLIKFLEAFTGQKGKENDERFLKDKSNTLRKLRALP